jgi:hypothetical protein
MALSQLLCAPSPEYPTVLARSNYTTVLPTSIMSASSSTTASYSTFRSIFHAASKEYKKKTGQDLRTHPLAVELHNCDSPDAVLELLQKQADALDDAGKSDQALMRWLDPTVHVLYMFSATLGEGIGLVSASELDFPVSSSMNVHERSICSRSLQRRPYLQGSASFSR